MEFGICTILFLAAAVGIAIFSYRMKDTEQKRKYILPLVLLSVLALALLAYLGLSILFIDSIQ